ncbi:MAG: redoxin domain-containing protein [Anaerolineae bacterium]|nr:redoxin domain-containing protein [Anaerolineae bacterium]
MDTGFRPEHVLLAPEFPAGEWINSPGVRLTSLRGTPVIVYFWDYASLPSLTFLGEIRRLERRYAEHGIAFIGVHTPTFSFERERQQVVLSTQRLPFSHPTLLDNEYAAARAFQIPRLPVAYLIDPKGKIAGSNLRGMMALEAKLQKTLRDLDPTASLPSLNRTASEQGAPELLELYAGVQRGVLGNPEGYAVQAPILYRLPERRRAGRFYIEGAWRAGEEHLAFEGHSEGIIHIPYEAVEVYAVFSPHHDLIERLLKPEPTTIEVWQDDRPLAGEQHGDDLTADGRAIIDRPRIYHLVRNPRQEQHELNLRVRSMGFSAYVFGLWGAAS